MALDINDIISHMENRLTICVGEVEQGRRVERNTSRAEETVFLLSVLTDLRDGKLACVVYCNECVHLPKCENGEGLGEWGYCCYGQRKEEVTE